MTPPVMVRFGVRKYVSPKPHKGAQKRKTAVFRLKLHFTSLEESLLQRFFAWILSAIKL